MEFSWKKILLLCGVVIGIIVLPLFLFSNPMVDYYARRAEADPESGLNKWLLMASADICYKTSRPEKSAEFYYKFMEKYPADPRRPRVFMRYAQSLEDANRNKEAEAMYLRYMEEYPDREDKSEAESGLHRIRYTKPNR